MLSGDRALSPQPGAPLLVADGEPFVVDDDDADVGGEALLPLDLDSVRAMLAGACVAELAAQAHLASEDTAPDELADAVAAHQLASHRRRAFAALLALMELRL